MRFLSMIRIDETTGQVPSEHLMADMDIEYELRQLDGPQFGCKP